MNRPINVGIVGATGLVGEVFLSLLEERKFPVGELRLFASEKSQGLSRNFGGKKIPIQNLKEDCFAGLQLVFFSSGDDISKDWAPKAIEAGAYAIDNSAAFRMHGREERDKCSKMNRQHPCSPEGAVNGQSGFNGKAIPMRADSSSNL